MDSAHTTSRKMPTTSQNTASTPSGPSPTPLTTASTSAAPGATAIRPLRELLSAIPQELYDIIYDMTFTSTAGIVNIQSSPKLASQASSHSTTTILNIAQVSHDIRARFLPAYFDATIFQFTNIDRCTIFVQTMPDHLKRLHFAVQCLKPEFPTTDSKHSAQVRAVIRASAEYMKMMKLVEMTQLWGLNVEMEFNYVEPGDEAEDEDVGGNTPEDDTNGEGTKQD